MRTLIRIFAVLALFTAGLSADYSSLYITHPQLLKSGQGTIEEAVIAMTPNGTFMKYDVTMTISAKNLSVFASTDSVEITYQFDLPAGSVVNDLWLWVGKDVSRGLILDRSTASATYENIVKRRRDPALLQKTGDNAYKLQIYPMAAPGSRTVKFSYSAPLTNTGGQWCAAVPGTLVRSSYVALKSLRVIYYAPTAGHVPSFVNDPRYTFTPWTDSLAHGPAWKCDIANPASNATDPAIAVPLKSAGNYTVTRFAGKDGGVYHVLLDPFSVLGVNTARKFLIAFDYDSVKTTMPRASYVDGVKAMLRTNCTPQDSFNVVFNDWQRSGEEWFAADSAGIARAFAVFGASAIPNGTNIPGLFMNALEFLNGRSENANILLIAASDKLGSPGLGDPVISWLRAKLPAGVGVYSLDLANRNLSYYRINNSYYTGNQYFYETLAKLTGGTAFRAFYVTIDDMTAALATAVRTMRGGLTSLDVQVRFENGFTYSRYPYGIIPFQTVYRSGLVGQIGKYVGSGAMTIEAAGFYDGEPYMARLAVPDSSIIEADSVLRAIWTGKSIADIEWSYTNTPAVIRSMTDACIRERVVCRYTALLALEPGDTLLTSANDRAQVPVTVVDDLSQPAAYQIAAAYPNPFNPSTTLRVRLPKGARAQDVTLRIYNMLGQLVRTFDPSGLTPDSFTEFRWEGTDEAGRRAASGMYLFVVSSPGARHTVKLMLLK